MRLLLFISLGGCLILLGNARAKQSSYELIINGERKGFAFETLAESVRYRQRRFAEPSETPNGRSSGRNKSEQSKPVAANRSDGQGTAGRLKRRRVAVNRLKRRNGISSKSVRSGSRGKPKTSAN